MFPAFLQRELDKLAKDPINTGDNDLVTISGGVGSEDTDDSETSDGACFRCWE
jgi:hypothetical protein